MVVSDLKRLLLRGGRRAVIVLFATLLLLVLTSAPAFAHGSGGPDATNFRSTVSGVALLGPDGRPAGRAMVPGVTWRVLANDALLEVANRSRQEVVVKGYSGEPYLRIGPDGVWENQSSEATYLNTDRFGGEIPERLNAQGPPSWRRIGDRPVHAWHDHRIHWMSRTDPPQVARSSAAVIDVFEWSVPFTYKERDMVVTGELQWVRPGPVWPWLLGALGVLSVPVLAAFVTRGNRRQALLRIGAGILGAVVVVDLIHSVDDVLAVPATFWQNVFASAQSAFFLAIGTIGAVWAWRGRSTAWVGLIIGAAAIAFGIGVSHVLLLASSQIATTLPEWYSRAAIAASVVVLVPAAFVAWRVHEPIPGFSVNPADEST